MIIDSEGRIRTAFGSKAGGDRDFRLWTRMNMLEWVYPSRKWWVGESNQLETGGAKGWEDS